MQEVFEKILERLEREARFYNSASDTDQNIRKGVCISKKIVEAVAEEYNGGWISCSERLPEERETVLLQDFDGFYELGVCIVKNNIKGFMDGDWWSSANNFIAWQPLPEPYKK